MPLYHRDSPTLPQENAHTLSQECVGLEMSGWNITSNPASAVWVGTNVALYMPFTLQRPAIAYRLWIANGAAVSGNFDIGLFDMAGNKLVSSGATAQSGTSVRQVLDITDTLLPRGTTWLGLSFDNVTATTLRSNPNALYLAALGVYQEASAYTLPATATYVRTTYAYLPHCGILFRSAA